MHSLVWKYILIRNGFCDSLGNVWYTCVQNTERQSYCIVGCWKYKTVTSYFNILSFLWMSASNARIMADDESCEIDPELIFAVLMLFAVNSSRGVHLHIQYEDQYLFNVWFV